jgi:hypothetical protein
MDPAWSGRGGGGGGCYASSGAELCRSCVPPAHQLASLLQSLAWLLHLNCNCCSQFAYDHVITQITISHFVSNNILLYHEKQHPPEHPLARARGCTHNHTRVNPSLGIPMRWYVILQNLNSQSVVLSRRVYLLIKYFSYSVKWILATGS